MTVTRKKQWNLFERFGIELEYMIVDKDTLQVIPRADIPLGKDKKGNNLSDIRRGDVGLSNELVSHVIELKCAEPTSSFSLWSKNFHKEIIHINKELAKINAMLLPSATHPFMNSQEEMVIWPYDANEIYTTYDRIFNCKGHGWANLQSAHLNISFNGDDQFEVLHAAIRILLPLIPAIAASSPYLDSKFTQFKDARLETYRHNQEKIPSIIGQIIPEPVFSYAEYDRVIFTPIKNDIAPYDTEHFLNHFFLNSRGAIARFDRGAIEIRLVDIQECPAADIAIAELQIAVLKTIISQKWTSIEKQKELETPILASFLHKTIKVAENAIIDDKSYLLALGIEESSIKASDVWKHLYKHCKKSITLASQKILEKMLARGTLSTVLLKKIGERPSRDRLVFEYAKLAECLAKNTLYEIDHD
jgi:gamma-glutamyl:cysteine ligase YbdK (ATP-grasp superfamily)